MPTSRWSKNAKIRRMQIEEGIDLTFCKVFTPFYMENITACIDDRLLEIGAGTGHLSKIIASNIPNTTAIEPSEGMYKVAKEVLEGSSVKLINCSIEDYISDIEYDFVISHLVAHVVEDFYRFLEFAYRNVKENGKFIFSIPHPCFYNDYKQLFDIEYKYMSNLKNNINFKITLDQKNEIYDVPYYHRPLSWYMNHLIKVGFKIDHFYEIFPDYKIQKLYGEEWENPRYCVFSCVK